MNKFEFELNLLLLVLLLIVPMQSVHRPLDGLPRRRERRHPLTIQVRLGPLQPNPRLLLRGTVLPVRSTARICLSEAGGRSDF